MQEKKKRRDKEPPTQNWRGKKPTIGYFYTASLGSLQRRQHYSRQKMFGLNFRRADLHNLKQMKCTEVQRFLSVSYFLIWQICCNKKAKRFRIKSCLFYFQQCLSVRGCFFFLILNNNNKCCPCLPLCRSPAACQRASVSPAALAGDASSPSSSSSSSPSQGSSKGG